MAILTSTAVPAHDRGLQPPSSRETQGAFILPWALGLLLLATTLNFGGTRLAGDLILSAGACLCCLIALPALLADKTKSPGFWLPCLLGAPLLLSLLLWLLHVQSPTPWPDFTLQHWNAISTRWPDGIIQNSPASKALLLISAVLLLLLLARQTQMRLSQDIVLLSLLLAGVLASTLALLEVFTHAAGIYWLTDLKLCTNFAGPFYHHTMMGAFCNLCWPAGLALASRLLERKQFWRFSFCLLGCLLVLSGHLCNVSRMPPLLALLGLALALWILLRKRPGYVQWLGFAGIPLLVVLLAFAVNRHTGMLLRIYERWEAAIEDHRQQPPTLTEAQLWPETSWPSHMRPDLFVDQTASSPQDIRMKLLQVGARAVVARPWLGHGPANWTGAAAQHSKDPLLRSFFQSVQFNHCDWLQVAVECGLPAGLGFLALLMGPVLWIFFTHRSCSPDLLLSALGVFLVGLQASWDFPLQAPALLLGLCMLSGLLWAQLLSPLNARHLA